MLIWIDLEGSNHDKDEVQSRNLAGGPEENYQNISVNEVSFSAEIETQDLSITMCLSLLLRQIICL
jgi:hypothetical protein